MGRGRDDARESDARCPVCDRPGEVSHVDLRAGTKRMWCDSCGMTWHPPVKPTADRSRSPRGDGQPRWTLKAVAERTAAAQQDAAEALAVEPEWLQRLRETVERGARSVRPRDLERLLSERDELLARADPMTVAEITAKSSEESDV